MPTPPPQAHPVLPASWETDRLILRQPSRRDAQAVQAAIEESFTELHPWVPWAAERQSLRETRTFLDRAQSRFRAGEDFALLAFLRDSGRFVLGTGLHPRDWSVPLFEIGYWCRSSMQRSGYTTESVRSVTEVAFSVMGAVRLEIRCDSRNDASRKVAERVGYRLEATLHAEARANDGSLRDTLVYTRLRDSAA